MENELTKTATDTSTTDAVNDVTPTSSASGTDDTAAKTYDEAYVTDLTAKLKAENDAIVKAAVEEAVKKERMSAEEKAKYETEQREAAILKREQEISQRELRADTMEMLSKANLPSSFADFLIGADAEATQKNVDSLKDAFDKAVQEQVESRFKGKTPRTGSGSGSSSESDEMQDIINKALGL